MPNSREKPRAFGMTMIVAKPVVGFLLRITTDSVECAAVGHR